MKDGVPKRNTGVDEPAEASLRSFRATGLADPALKSYLDLCSDYLKRQIIVYENWPQRRFSPLGYSDEKVFRDQNA